ncbi:hypothetical protein [Candidatus Phytoplasma sp. AldY-WA1]|uniref:hypothetical protein n=1 Tax=Candidatus Phytoplasma sp. AldY-WA1 TaxID=2852100 RepID=UPI00254DFD0C|nr:hypothetical protein [Candidatus Phytoplasma sp. AldY-WA1]
MEIVWYICVIGYICLSTVVMHHILKNNIDLKNRLDEITNKTIIKNREKLIELENKIRDLENKIRDLENKEQLKK